MILVQDHDFIVAQYAKTFADDEDVDPLRKTYWLGCYSADAAPVIENLPPPPFGLIVETPASGDMYPVWFDTFEKLIRDGVVCFLQFGPIRRGDLSDVFVAASVAIFDLPDPDAGDATDEPMVGMFRTLPEAVEYAELCVGSSPSQEPDLLDCVVLSLCPEDSAPS